jgi:hypothetical protein
MKKLIAAAFVVAVFLAGSEQTVSAGDGDAIGFFWQQHERSVNGIMTAWRSGAPHTAYGGSLQELVSSEAGLLAYKVPSSHPKMYSRLAENLPGNNPEVFAWRLFRERLKESGVAVGNPGSTLAYTSFIVREIASGRDGSVRF